MMMEIERHTEPFTHWIIYDLLTVQMIDEIYSVNPTLTADTNKCRSYFYFTPDNISSYPHMESFVNNFIGFKPLLEKYRKTQTTPLPGAEENFDNAYLRVAVTVDKFSYYLKRHTDIKEKLLALVVYLNREANPNTIGTELHHLEDLTFDSVKTIPFKHNVGLMIAPGLDTWHSFTNASEIKTARRCLMVNIQTPSDDLKRISPGHPDLIATSWKL